MFPSHDLKGQIDLSGDNDYSCSLQLNDTEFDTTSTEADDQAISIDHEAWGANWFSVNCTWTTGGITYWEESEIHYT